MSKWRCNILSYEHKYDSPLDQIMSGGSFRGKDWVWKQWIPVYDMWGLLHFQWLEWEKKLGLISETSQRFSDRLACKVPSKGQATDSPLSLARAQIGLFCKYDPTHQIHTQIMQHQNPKPNQCHPLIHSPTSNTHGAGSPRKLRNPFHRKNHRTRPSESHSPTPRALQNPNQHSTGYKSSKVHHR